MCVMRVFSAQEKARLRSARTRLSARWRRGHSKAVALLLLSEEEATEGRSLFQTNFMPEIVSSPGSDDQDGAHYVYFMLPWLSDKARAVFKLAHDHAATYPDALPVLFSPDDSVNPKMLTAPRAAPSWAVQVDSV
jgi:hypothetical protein